MRTMTVNEDRMRQALLNRGMATQEAEAILRDLNGETPPKGYIRFSEAVKRYGVKEGTLNKWILRGHVHRIQVRRKLCWVNEEQVRRRTSQNKA